MTGTDRLFRLPDLGEGLTEAEVVEWRVAAGDPVAVDQIVVVVETAKAAVEVPVPFAGTVARLHVEAGATLAVGEPLISVRQPAGSGNQPAGADSDSGSTAGPDDAPATPSGNGSGSGNVLVGYGTSGEAGPARSRPRRRVTAMDRAAMDRAAMDRAATDRAATDRAAMDRAGTGPAVADPSVAGNGAPRVISPLVRRLAREHGVDVARVAPSGPGGVVLRRDVERAIDRLSTPEPTRESIVERIPIRGVRRTVVDKVTRSRAEIPDATTWVDVDATGLLEARDALRAAEPDLPIGVLALLARICVAGLRRFPALNSTVDIERNEIVRYGAVHLGFAAQTDRGLVVPVVRDAHLRTTGDLAVELARLTALARTGELPPDLLTGSTFTLNNYGVFGVDGSTPIINHPEAALLGVGRIVDKPWVVDGALAVRKVGQLSLTFDHRVCDGGEAGGFLRFVADRVEHPTALLANL